MREIRYIKVIGTGIPFMSSVNGVPLVWDYQGNGIEVCLPIDRWLMQNGNTWTIDVLGSPSSTRKARLYAEVFLADSSSETPIVDVSYGRINWSGDQEWVPVIAKPILMDHLPACTLWRLALPISELSRQDRNDMLAIIEQLRQAVLAGEAEDAYELQSFRFEEDARVEGKKESRIREVVIEQYRWLQSWGKLESTPLHESDASFSIVANSLLVHVQRDTRSMPIVIEAQELGRTIAIDVFFARIGRKWIIAR